MRDTPTKPRQQLCTSAWSHDPADKKQFRRPINRSKSIHGGRQATKRQQKASVFLNAEQNLPSLRKAERFTPAKNQPDLSTNQPLHHAVVRHVVDGLRAQGSVAVHGEGQDGVGVRDREEHERRSQHRRKNKLQPRRDLCSGVAGSFKNNREGGPPRQKGRISSGSNTRRMRRMRRRRRRRRRRSVITWCTSEYVIWHSHP